MWRPIYGDQYTFMIYRCFLLRMRNVSEKCFREYKKKLAPSSILREAKVAYYARNMFEAGRFVLFFVKAT